MGDAASQVRKWSVVNVEACHCGVPELAFEHDYKDYYQTYPEEVLERVKDADIVFTTITPITPEVAEQCSRLKLIAIMATGYGWLDKAYFDKRGITVINCPGSNIAAVSEHAIGLYFAARRRFLDLHNRALSTDDWERVGTLSSTFPRPPLGCGQEELGIIGYGALGKRIETLAKGLGFAQVAIAERKGAATRPGRVALEEMLKNCTVLMVCCPLTASTTNLIGSKELQSMRKDAILINVARGGIVNEAALVAALGQGWIEAAAVDVLEIEPPKRGSTPMLPLSNPVPNLIISPHLGWYGQQSIQMLQQLLKAGVEGFVKGRPINIVAGNYAS